MSVKLSLTYKLLKLNSALKLIFSVIEDKCSGGQRSSKCARQHFKTSYSSSYSSNGKQTAKWTSYFINFYAVLELFEANSGHLQNVYRL